MRAKTSKLSKNSGKHIPNSFVQALGKSYSLLDLCKTMTPYRRTKENLDVEPLASEFWDYKE